MPDPVVQTNDSANEGASPPTAGTHTPMSAAEAKHKERRATRSILVGGVLFLALLSGFAATLHAIYVEFLPSSLHLVDVRFQDEHDGQRDIPNTLSSTSSTIVTGATPETGAEATLDEMRMKQRRSSATPTKDDEQILDLDQQALKLHYFATFAHREILGFWFNLLAGSLLILFGIFVFFESVLNGEPEGENAFEFKTGGGSGLVLTLKSRSLGMVAVTSGAAVLLLVKQANQPTTDIVEAYFRDTREPAEAAREEDSDSVAEQKRPPDPGPTPPNAQEEPPFPNPPVGQGTP